MRTKCDRCDYAYAALTELRAELERTKAMVMESDSACEVARGEQHLLAEANVRLNAELSAAQDKLKLAELALMDVRAFKAWDDLPGFVQHQVDDALIAIRKNG